ncbi:MAG: hypothetical protein KF774_10590 [Planctomyces sp.]|nr:hypothetical protein [Planctomyces sp.]
MTHDYQSHAGAVNTMTTPNVQYAYANGSDNTIRPTALTYPDGRVLNSSYGTTDGIDDAASRVASLIDDDGTSHLADYAYLGMGTFVEQDDAEPDVKWTLADLAGSDDPDTGDIYSGFDRFGRVKDNRWRDYGSSVDADRIRYGYDRASNRIWRENAVATAQSKDFDELYTNDAIHRLKDLQRGRLNGGHTALTTKTFAQCWSLDPTGNRKQPRPPTDQGGARSKAVVDTREDANGNGTWDLDQARTSNTVNEITDITETAGPAWATPAYNRAGNMTAVPKPNAPTGSYTATYDAWNRLAKLAYGSDTVSEYAYDGAQRRIVQLSYVAGTLSETRHLYYTDPSQWQVVEERVGSSSDAERQCVWGLRYVDDCVLRDRDTDAIGSLDERLYALQDGNWNVTGLVDPDGDVQERFAYTAYGVPLFLAANFTPQGSSGAGWEPLYCGYRHEAATGLFHVRHRVLHPALGTWVQRDPLRGPLQPSRYQYAKGHVLVAVDPSGLIECKLTRANIARFENRSDILAQCKWNCKCPPGSKRRRASVTVSSEEQYTSDPTLPPPAGANPHEWWKEQVCRRNMESVKIALIAACNQGGDDGRDDTPIAPPIQPEPRELPERHEDRRSQIARDPAPARQPARSYELAPYSRIPTYGEDRTGMGIFCQGVLLTGGAAAAAIATPKISEAIAGSACFRCARGVFLIFLPPTAIPLQPGETT